MGIRVDHIMAASIKMDSRTRKWLVSRVTDIMSFVERERDNAKPMANGLAINPHVLQVSTVHQCQGYTKFHLCIPFYLHYCYRYKLYELFSEQSRTQSPQAL